ncbi:MAG TPA: helix-turn-helix transcriptional regulator [Cyclobacteriaceae bacterium]|nr:helix-turn-helix transcriptional regulator [Cyclobacteriaceae bacterium]
MEPKKKKEMLRKFGLKLSELRTKRGLSFRELAALCDVDASDIQKYETGQVNPTIATIGDLAAGLNVQPKDLLDFEI